jgi:TolA-binding protein
MSRAACSWSTEIDRAVRPEADPRLSAHLDGCDQCRAERRQLLRAVVMLQALPYQPPDEDAREQARTRLVASLSGRPPRPAARRWLRGGVVLGASLCGSIVAAAVGSHVWQRQELPPIAPAPPSPARRIRPAHPRPMIVPQVAPPAEEPAPLIQRPPVRPSPRRVAQVITPPPLPQPEAGPAERAFNQGWEALRSGDRLGAAAQMRRALELEPGNALAEDARYWRAVALGRAGAAGEARQAMEEFLREHPRSPRAGEVSVMLGWLLVDAGEKGRAAILFQAAAGDARSEVRGSAQAGLKAVGSAGP